VERKEWTGGCAHQTSQANGGADAEDDDALHKADGGGGEGDAALDLPVDGGDGPGEPDSEEDVDRVGAGDVTQRCIRGLLLLSRNLCTTQPIPQISIASEHAQDFVKSRGRETRKVKTPPNMKEQLRTGEHKSKMVNVYGNLGTSRNKISQTLSAAGEGDET
jgi:hypothetical protein